MLELLSKPLLSTQALLATSGTASPKVHENQVVQEHRPACGGAEQTAVLVQRIID
jgi:hypothetical protein